MTEIGKRDSIKNIWGIFNNNWVKSLVINLVILITVLAATDIMYESVDDYMISLQLQEGYPYVGFVNYFLCKLLISFQNFFPGINIFVLFQLISSFFAFTTILCVLLKKNRHFIYNLFCCLVIFTYSFNHYALFQFSKTSALLLVAGTLLFFEGTIRDKRAVNIVISFLFIYLGAWTRSSNVLMALGFLGVYLVIWCVLNINVIKRSVHVIYNKKSMICYSLSLILFVILLASVSVSKEMNSSTEQLKEYKEYNKYRSAFLDYPQPEYEGKNKEYYESLDINKGDLEVLSGHYLDYDGAAGLQNLKKLDELKDKPWQEIVEPQVIKTFIKDIYVNIANMNSIGIHIIILVLIALASAILFKPKYIAGVIAIGIMTVAMYLYLYYIGRPIYRATYGVDLAATVWLLYYFRDSLCRMRARRFINRMTVTKKITASIFIVIVMLLLSYPMYKQGIWQGSLRGDIGETKLHEYIENNKNSFFVFDTALHNYYQMQLPYYTNPLSVVPDDFEKNVTTFGDWWTLSPYIMDKLHKNGVNNVFEDIIDMPNAYIIEGEYTDTLERYFNKYYGNDRQIRLEHIKKFGDYDVLQVVSTNN